MIASGTQMAVSINMNKATKIATARKAAWNKALAEGRIVKHNGGMTMTSYSSAAAAEAVVKALLEDGLDAEIIKVKS